MGMAYTLPRFPAMPATSSRHPHRPARASRDPGVVRANFFAAERDGRIRCHLCPRACLLADGEKGACRVRARRHHHMVFSRYGLTTGFCMDPIEKKPLFHFLPGYSALSFGTVGCNLACDFCQNWHLSQPETAPLSAPFASPEAVANAAKRHGAASVAMTYNDPVIFYEYALDVAHACRESGIHPVAITAAYLTKAAAAPFFGAFDAANVDLKAFSRRFYRNRCDGDLHAVLAALDIAREKTTAWLEITNLLIPGENDSDSELRELVEWIAGHLGNHTPVHFSAFHPDHRLLARPATPHATLARARAIAKAAGLSHVYLGNVPDRDGEATTCSRCQATLIIRDRYAITGYHLTGLGTCPSCGHACDGVFGEKAGTFGNRRFTVDVR